LGRLNIARVVYYNPYDSQLVGRLAELYKAKVYYDWTDNWALYYGKPSISLEESTAVKSADGVITVTKRLEERATDIRGSSDKILYLPNATSWRPEIASSIPEDLRNIKKPRIGFSGHVGPLIDFRLLKVLASEKPEWNWVFVGSVDDKTKTGFHKFKNFHFLGQKQFHELKSYLDHCQVSVAPYKLSNVEGDATKLYDYLAVGNPIVSSRIETAKRMAPFIRIADTPTEWVSCISESINSDDDIENKQRQLESRNHSWKKRSRILINWWRTQEGKN
jgi:hypothetical protein